MTEFLRKIGKSDIRNILAVITVIGSFVILYLMLITAIPKDNKDTVNLALGFVLGGLVSGVAGYYFGASKDPKSSGKEE